MKYILIPALVATALPLTLSAQTTGTIQGKVSDSKGNPIPGAKIVISKVGVTWIKELKSGTDGKFLQVGLEPKEYEITVSASGYVDYSELGRVALATVTKKEFVLYTPEEAVKAGKATAGIDAGAAAESKALDSYNQAVAAYNQKEFANALPLFETAISGIKESIEKTNDEKVKSEAQTKLETMERPYVFSLIEVAKTDEARKVDLGKKAEPILLKMLERNNKDQNIVAGLLEVAKAKNDPTEIQKYQAAYDAIVGPRPENAYNDGVQAFNENKFEAAKASIQKAIQIDPKFPDSYYILGLIETNMNHLPAAKSAFLKYMELAPTGKKAGEVKELLDGLKAMGVK